MDINTLFWEQGYTHDKYRTHLVNGMCIDYTLKPSGTSGRKYSNAVGSSKTEYTVREENNIIKSVLNVLKNDNRLN